MIPQELSLSGFLSYRDPVTIDFSSFDLACISGANGAGKSSLLDAITWALFGQARQRDDSLINNQSETADVSFTFCYEGNLYRVLRSKTRGKTTVLELHIRPANGEEGTQNWKPLTEHTLRATQERIQKTLRLDYETFVNAAFFLQGKADQFTQQRASDRKRILSSILGLEIWETYRQAAGERRRRLQGEIENLDGRLQEINSELAEEQTRKEKLKSVEADLARLSAERTRGESSLENIRKIHATLEEQRKLVATLNRSLEAASESLAGLEERLVARRAEQEGFTQTLERAPEIEADYQAWEQARSELERWEEIAMQFREFEEQRSQPLAEINAARVQLETEQDTLLKQEAALEATRSEIPPLQEALDTGKRALAQAQARLDQRVQLELDLATARERKAEAQAENPRLKAEMDELKERIDQLEGAEGANCPLCGQPLGPEDRQALIADFTQRGTEMGDRYRANKAHLEESDQLVSDLETQFAALGEVEAELRQQARQVDQVTLQLEGIQDQIGAWEKQGAPRLAEIRRLLVEESYAPAARTQLAEINARLKAIGYDAGSHDATRKAEAAGRASEGAYRTLEKARAALAPLEREIDDLEGQIQTQRAALSQLDADHTSAAANLAATEASAPDLEAAEADLLQVQEEENRLRLEVGAARQKVEVLDDLRARRKRHEGEREELARRVGQYRQLERAFGKDGVPALLIEQALPQIEAKANELLDRLSGGSMAVRFVTQSEYKDKRREDLKETLDIQISDSAGARDYELYSGGEAFRVNFAIRLALSEVLAQRAGARLQTLVIDEGFGSQDAAGRQRLLEAINLVRPDFAKILVITHIDELKDAFPTRIEVEKTERGSAVTVI